ncbi:DUF6332 family protein [Streptomyces albipurpureus]
MAGRRTQAHRDAITVEIGYALLSGVFAAAVVFCAIAGIKLLFLAPYVVERGLFLAAWAAAVLVFVVRVVSVLWRFTAASGEADRVRQPNQPGLTNPDS